MRSTDLAILSLTCALLAACPSGGEDAPVADVPAETGDTNRIAIPATVRKNLGLTFAEVEVRNVAETLRVPGAFELRPSARHEYRMALAGRVELFVDQYEEVDAGQPLFRFQSPSWPELLHEIVQGEQAIDTALAQIEVGRARVDEARRKLANTRDRLEALARADFKHAELEAQADDLEASLPRLGAEIGLAETSLANARRTREHALHRASTASGIPEEELAVEVTVGGETVPRYRTIDWIEVPALEAGVVESLAVTNGAFVEPPSVVLTTVDPDRVRFRAMALQADLPVLQGAVEALIVPPRSPGVPIELAVDATLSIGLEAHPQERIFALLAIPARPAPWIRPGVSAFLEVVTGSSGGAALAIPRSAVVQDGLAHVFFRRDPADPNTAIRVEADLGVDDGRWVVVESGIVRGDEVVLDGAYELKLAMDKRGGAPIDGAHVHADGTTHDDH
jgi:hypothetical protein